MIKKIVFATHNAHKVQEISALLEEKIKIIGLSELGFSSEIPETQNTLEGNAHQKAEFIYSRFGVDCFADDTGLEVDVLKGAPGVYSARYAGEHCNFEDNIVKLLREMDGKENRHAQFRTIISLIIDNAQYLFEGKVEGAILTEKRGVGGFGYDPVFVPNGYQQTFAEMPLVLKNSISHRGKATQKLITFLENYSSLISK